MIAIDFSFQLHMPLVWYAGLPAAAWMVYLGDHLFDTIKASKPSLTSRHVFITSHQKPIIGLIVLLFFSCMMMLILSYNYQVFFAAAMCLPFIGAYFGLTFFAGKRFQLLFNKELLVAFIYTFAIYATLTINSYDWPSYLPAFLALFIVSYSNLLMMSILEMKNDIEANKFSWALILGKRNAERLLFIVFSIGIGVIIHGLTHTYSQRIFTLMWLYTAMLLFHVVLYMFKKKIADTDTIRKLSDAIFWIPAFCMLMN